MAIVQTINSASQFADMFKQSSRADQFSYEALEAIYEYLDDFSRNTGETIELDIVSICCEWYEMSWKEVAEQYNVDLSDCVDDDERIKAVDEYLWEETQSINLDNGSFVFVQL
jgi:hypothetical protein